MPQHDEAPELCVGVTHFLKEGVRLCVVTISNKLHDLGPDRALDTFGPRVHAVVRDQGGQTVLARTAHGARNPPRLIPM